MKNKIFSAYFVGLDGVTHGNFVVAHNQLTARWLLTNFHSDNVYKFLDANGSIPIAFAEEHSETAETQSRVLQIDDVEDVHALRNAGIAILGSDFCTDCRLPFNGLNFGPFELETSTGIIDGICSDCIYERLIGRVAA